jgi:hypothetical protein
MFRGKRRERKESRETKREVQEITMISMRTKIERMFKRMFKIDQEGMIGKTCHQKTCLEASN